MGSAAKIAVSPSELETGSKSWVYKTSSSLVLVAQVAHRRPRETRRGAPPPTGSDVSRLAPMRTVYLGTSDFAAEVLDRLAAGPHRPQLVVTRPDRPRGRGRKLAPPPVAEAAARLGIEHDPAGQRERGGGARAASPPPSRHAVCICAYGALIKEPLLSDHEWFNVHPSLLPRWRGAAPIERAIEAGDEETGRDHHATHRGDGRRARSACSATSRSSPTTTSARCPRAWRCSAASCWWRRWTTAPVPRAARDGDHLRGEDRPRGPPARPAVSRRGAGAPRAGVDPARGRVRGAGVGRAPGRAAGGAQPERQRGAAGLRRGGRWAAAVGTASGVLELLEVQPAGGPPDGGGGLPTRPRSGQIARGAGTRATSVGSTAPCRLPTHQTPDGLPAVSLMWRAGHARHQPARPLPLRVLPAVASSCARPARTAARTPPSRACPTRPMWTCRSCGASMLGCAHLAGATSPGSR